ncbi:MAG: hypothetical protein GXO70_06645 [Acidobacteria bacterium]|nr:hypothetical protein [Acidobacteriota bacterium]
MASIVHSTGKFRCKSNPKAHSLRYNHRMEKAPSFTVDIMLGKLAKWLRLMGFDTFYSNKATDDFLMELTFEEKRILLTRDRPLVQRVGTAAYFVQNIFLPEQLKEVTSIFKLHRFHPQGRCSVCNGVLVSIPKSDIEGRVPPYVFQTQEQFFQCQSCEKLYWKGTHIRHIEKMISGTLRPVADETLTSQEKDNG